MPVADYIAAPFPHMVLNSHDVPPPDYEMWNSWKVGPNETADHMVEWIREVAKGAQGKKLATLIFNAHGSPGTIHVGKGISSGDVMKFYGLNGFVTEIWIVACRVAGDDSDVASLTYLGSDFCKDLAITSGATVTAATKNQPSSGPVSIPPWHIDAWVGKIIKVNPQGNPVP
jgi:hypothetical protein